MPPDQSRDSQPDISRVAPPAGMPANPSLSYNPKVGGSFLGTPSQELEETASPTRVHEYRERAIGEETRRLGEGRGPVESEASKFTLLRLIGRGGMGEVWEAIQRRLWRRVAVKRLRRGEGSITSRQSQAMTREFHGEALTSALLDHPNIVPVHDLGYDESGSPLLAMKLVEGQSWDKILRIDFESVSVDTHLARHLPILVQVAQAVAFAHSKGVVHRDLKPSQVMVGDYGEVLLMDWGLAVMVGAPPEFVGEESHQALYPARDSAMNPAGTPGYMAPEQTSAYPDRIAPWTDVYLLGGILFNVLTGRRPHPGENSDQAFLAASEGIVLGFGEAAPGRAIPRELEALATRCLNPVPGERPTAIEFVEGIQDFLSGATRQRESMQITSALAEERLERTYAGCVAALGRIGQAQRLWPENPAAGPVRERVVQAYASLALEAGDLTLAKAQAERLADAVVRGRLLREVAAAEEKDRVQRRRLRQFATATYLFLATIIVGGYFFTMRLKAANAETLKRLDETAAARKAESTAKAAAEQESERAQLLLADSLVSQDRREEAITELLRIPEERRFWEWGFVLTRATRDLLTIPLEYLAWSPDKYYAVGASREEGLCLVRAESGEVLLKLADAVPDALVTCFSRDSRFLALAGAGTRVRVFDMAERRLMAALDAPTTSTIRALELAPEARRIAIGDEVGNVRLCDLQGGRVVDVGAHGRRIRALFWGERRLVSVSLDMVRRIDPGSGDSEIVRETGSIEGQFHPFATSSDVGRRYFALQHHRHGTLYGRVDEGPLHLIDMECRGFSLLDSVPWIFAGGGVSLPSFSLVDMETGEEVPSPGNIDLYTFASPNIRHVPAYNVGEMLPSADEGIALVTTGAFAYAKVQVHPFNHLALQQTLTLPRDTRRAQPTPDLKAIWVVDADGITHLRPVDAEYIGTKIPGTVASFGPGDRYTAQIALSWLEQRDVETGDVIFIGGRAYNLYLGGHTTSGGTVIFLPGRRGSLFTIEKSARDSNALLGTYELPGVEVGRIALHADTAKLAVIEDTGRRILTWDLSGPQAVAGPARTIEEGDYFLEARHSADGSELVVSTSSGRLLRWDATTLETRSDHRAHDGPIMSLLFSTSRSEWVTVGADRAVRFWKAKALEPVGEGLRFDFDVQGLSISRSGKWLLAWPERGAPVLREIDGGRVVARLERTDFPMNRVRFIAEDSRIMASANGAARFWDPITGRETFNIDEGFGEISNDSRKIIYYASTYDGTLMEIAPTRALEGGGGSAGTFRERLDDWMADRYRKWCMRRVRELLPPELEQLSRVDGPVAGGEAVAALTPLLALNSPPFQPPANPVAWTEDAGPRLLMTLLEAGHGERLLTLNPEWIFIARSPDRCTPAARAAIIASVTDWLQAIERDPRIEDASQITGRVMRMDALARVYRMDGRHDLALQIVKRARAIRSIGHIHPGESAQLLEEWGAAPPPAPPEDLVMQPPAGLPPRLLRRLQNAAASSPGSADVWLQVREMWGISRADIDAWLDEVAPAPDWAALSAEARRHPGWQPYPADLSVKEIVAQVRERFELRAYGGRTLEQALEGEGRRVDEMFASRRRAGVGSR